jgi:hypothetical protein
MIDVVVKLGVCDHRRLELLFGVPNDDIRIHTRRELPFAMLQAIQFRRLGTADLDKATNGY